ncbi:TonB-dependent receptor [Arcticibacter svalbardensis MN12-7]|uniref:TonB-dependent receptor n=2 Tax=Arcticibacter TaxID=1288026 RepID=R9GT73_9SPHI|nr:TonB-dependent receptor [Arcticibacter svalbardensis MN12-7]
MIQGTVKSNQGETLPGVSVTIKETKKGEVTDVNGKYSISAEKGQILLFNYLGFKTLTVEVTDQKVLNVSLEEESSNLDEVVVIGYGTQKKSSVTGAVSKLTNTNLDEIPTSRLDNALVGKIAGVTIQNVSSEAGATPVIRIRGFSSINTNSGPLVVVDGYPVPDGMSFVNPQDVESVEVLKDAASAAIYGSRAANGVILITTKSGNSDKPKYSFKTSYGVKNTYKLNDIMTFSEYVQGLYSDAALRAQDPSVAVSKQNLVSTTEKAAYIIENEIADGPTDWQDAGLQNASVYNVQLGLSGGTKDLKYYLSGSYQKDQAAIKFSDNTRGTFKAKINGNISKKLKFSLNFNPTYVGTTSPAANFTDYYRFYSFLPTVHTEATAAFVRQNSQWADINAGDFAQARHFANLNYSGTMPDGSTYTSAGTIVPWTTNNNTPLSIASRESVTKTSYRILSSGDLSYEIIPKLIFKTSIGGYYTSQDNKDLLLSNAKTDGGVNESTVSNTNYKDVLWENTLNYNWKKGDHNFTGLLGFTTQQTWITTGTVVGRNYAADQLDTQPSLIDLSLTKTYKDQVGLLSYLGRLTYDYKNKYLFSTSFRTDGSSYFNVGKKYGYFPSFSAGWVVSNEDFMQGIRTTVSNLKFRTSYGATGNNKISSFSYQNLLYPANYGFGSGNGSVILGLSPNNAILANANITWERTYAYNFGMDLGLLNNRLNLTVEYYNSQTDKLLYNQSTMSFSGSNKFINNAGKVRNNGVEFEFSSNNVKTKNFDWNTALNLSVNKNTLIALGGEVGQYNYGERNEVYAALIDQPSIQYFGYKTDGVWTSQAMIDAALASGQTTSITRYYTAGGLKIVDTNNDNVINEADRTTIGTPFPDFTWGATNTFKIKNFDLSITIQGSQGGKLINGDAYYQETKKFNRNFNNSNRWISDMFPGDGKTPYYTNGVDMMLTDYVVEDASYASLRNVILGYSLPKTISKKMGLSGVRVYGSAENLFYVFGKDYRAINPEARTTSTTDTNPYYSPLVDGYQRGAFPILRSFIFGVDLNF